MNNFQTRILSIDDPNAIPQALSVLEAGELIVFPTDTLYGLAGQITEASVQKIFAAKLRPEEKAIPVLVGSLHHLDQLTSWVKPEVLTLMQTFWPGALTLVLPKKDNLPPSLSPYSGLAVRMPDHPFALRLLQQSGPLAVTSANISGGENPSTSEEVYAQLNHQVAIILDGGKHPGGKASTIIDCQAEEPQLLREGPIPFDEVMRIWRSK